MRHSGSKSFASSMMRAEMLDHQTEIALSKRWRDQGDSAALERLVASHMRLAISAASKFKRYGADPEDLVQEASVGLLKAASKFDPDRGVRFSTYAVWWIKAAIQEFVMRNASVVRTSSTSLQKSLFFNFARLKAEFANSSVPTDEKTSADELLEQIARKLKVPLRDVKDMEGRLSGGDVSLNAALSSAADGYSLLDTLADDSVNVEQQFSREYDMAKAKSWILEALATLPDRERKIVVERKLTREPKTLEALGQELGVSKERVRQIEGQALIALRQRLKDRCGERAENLLF